MAFQCTVLTPEQQLVNEEVTQVILPAHDGLVGILTNRAPLMVKLGIGPMRVDLPSGKQQWYMVEGGLAQMKENVLTVLTSAAMAASDIDANAAAQEYSAAVARSARTQPEIDEREKALQRARAKQAIAHK